MKRIIAGIFLLVLISGGVSAVPPRKIVSLAPSMTEILFALGLEERIAAVTAFCDYPPEARKKPKIGGMSNPSLEAILRIRPDIVVMTKDGNPREVEARLRGFGIRTYVATATRIHELPGEIRNMGKVLGVPERAERLAERIEDSMERARDVARGFEKGGKAIFIVWPEPLIVVGPGTAVDDAFRLLGWTNIAGDAKSRYPKYSIEEIIHRSPDAIFIGKGHADMRKLSRGILRRLEMTDAVRNGRVYYPSDALFRLGPRVIEGIRELGNYLEESRNE